MEHSYGWCPVANGAEESLNPVQSSGIIQRWLVLSLRDVSQQPGRAAWRNWYSSHGRYSDR